MSVNIWNSNDISLSYFDPDDLKNLNKSSLKQKLLRDFFRAYFFKSLFKLARKLDKNVNIHKILNFDSIIEIFFHQHNLEYALYVLMIKTLFKIYRFIITRWFDKNWFYETYETQEKWNYKMVNIIKRNFNFYFRDILWKRIQFNFLYCFILFFEKWVVLFSIQI